MKSILKRTGNTIFILSLITQLFFLAIMPVEAKSHSKDFHLLDKEIYAATRLADNYLENEPIDQSSIINKNQITSDPSLGNLRENYASDDFGYTWNDEVPLEWIDATVGINTGMTGNSGGQVYGPVALGFSFPYYENELTDLYIAASGYVGFDESSNWPSQSHIPASGEPNNVIAPYWAPLYLTPNSPAGEVYFLQGGDEPDRYFVVEWFEVAGYRPDDTGARDDLFHFQVILYENGDIRFQYGLMNFTENSYCASAGIEDFYGEDGLNYLPFCSTPPTNQAVLFSRPELSARVQASPNYQSKFINPGGSNSFPISLKNIGDLGEDTYSLEVVANWTVTMLDSDQKTPLIDLDGDGKIDVGPLAEDEEIKIFANVSADPAVKVGTQEEIDLTFTSQINSVRSQTVKIQVAVPSRFTQVFRDDADGAMSLFYAKPQESSVKPATSNGWWGYNPVVAEIPSGNFLYLWERYRYLENTSIIVSEIEYRLVNYTGDPLTDVIRLTSHGSSSSQIYDEQPVLAVAPDGSIGIAWRRRTVREVEGTLEENWNVYFAIMDQYGSIEIAPKNLTQNGSWYRNGELNFGVPRFWNVRISANEQNQFGLVWHQESQETASGTCIENCSLNDIYITIWHSSGVQIRPITRMTNDIISGYQSYSSPNLVALSRNRWLLAYNHREGGMAFSVLDAEGNLIRERSFIAGTGFGWSTVVKQSIGKERVTIAWTAWAGNNPQVHMVVLNSNSFDLVNGPMTLTNPAASTGGDLASLAQDAKGNMIVTWTDFSSSNRRNLYYAYLDENGEIITDPMVFYQAKDNSEMNMHIETSQLGYSNTSNSQFTDVAITYWAATWIESLYDSNITMGCVADPPQFCPEGTLTRAQMAVFLGRAIYGTIDPPDSDGEIAGIFTDIPDNFWAGPWIEKLYQDGITRGCSEDPLRFCPHHEITRDQMAVFLIRYLYGDETNLPGPTGEIFADVSKDHWAAAEIEQLFREGITMGCGTDPLIYCPNLITSRAEIAAFLVRTFDLP